MQAAVTELLDDFSVAPRSPSTLLRSHSTVKAQTDCKTLSKILWLPPLNIPLPPTSPPPPVRQDSKLTIPLRSTILSQYTQLNQKPRPSMNTTQSPPSIMTPLTQHKNPTDYQDSPMGCQPRSITHLRGWTDLYIPTNTMARQQTDGTENCSPIESSEDSLSAVISNSVEKVVQDCSPLSPSDDNISDMKSPQISVRSNPSSLSSDKNYLLNSNINASSSTTTASTSDGSRDDQVVTTMFTTCLPLGNQYPVNILPLEPQDDGNGNSMMPVQSSGFKRQSLLGAPPSIPPYKVVYHPRFPYPIRVPIRNPMQLSVLHHMHRLPVPIPNQLGPPLNTQFRHQPLSLKRCQTDDEMDTRKRSRTLSADCASSSGNESEIVEMPIVPGEEYNVLQGSEPKEGSDCKKVNYENEISSIPLPAIKTENEVTCEKDELLPCGLKVGEKDVESNERIKDERTSPFKLRNINVQECVSKDKFKYLVVKHNPKLLKCNKVLLSESIVTKLFSCTHNDDMKVGDIGSYVGSTKGGSVLKESVFDVLNEDLKGEIKNYKDPSCSLLTKIVSRSENVSVEINCKHNENVVSGFLVSTDKIKVETEVLDSTSNTTTPETADETMKQPVKEIQSTQSAKIQEMGDESKKDEADLCEAKVKTSIDDCSTKQRNLKRRSERIKGSGFLEVQKSSPNKVVRKTRKKEKDVSDSIVAKLPECVANETVLNSANSNDGVDDKRISDQNELFINEKNVGESSVNNKMSDKTLVDVVCPLTDVSKPNSNVLLANKIKSRRISFKISIPKTRINVNDINVSDEHKILLSSTGDKDQLLKPEVVLTDCKNIINFTTYSVVVNHLSRYETTKNNSPSILGTSAQKPINENCSDDRGNINNNNAIDISDIKHNASVDALENDTVKPNKVETSQLEVPSTKVVLMTNKIVASSDEINIQEAVDIGINLKDTHHMPNHKEYDRNVFDEPGTDVGKVIPNELPKRNILPRRRGRKRKNFGTRKLLLRNENKSEGSMCSNVSGVKDIGNDLNICGEVPSMFVDQESSSCSTASFKRLISRICGSLELSENQEACGKNTSETSEQVIFTKRINIKECVSATICILNAFKPVSKKLYSARKSVRFVSRNYDNVLIIPTLSDREVKKGRGRTRYADKSNTCDVIGEKTVNKLIREQPNANVQCEMFDKGSTENVGVSQTVRTSSKFDATDNGKSDEVVIDMSVEDQSTKSEKLLKSECSKSVVSNDHCTKSKLVSDPANVAQFHSSFFPTNWSETIKNSVESERPSNETGNKMIKHSSKCSGVLDINEDLPLSIIKDTLCETSENNDSTNNSDFNFDRNKSESNASTVDDFKEITNKLDLVKCSSKSSKFDDNSIFNFDKQCDSTEKVLSNVSSVENENLCTTLADTNSNSSDTNCGKLNHYSVDRNDSNSSFNESNNSSRFDVLSVTNDTSSDFNDDKSDSITMRLRSKRQPSTKTLCKSAAKSPSLRKRLLSSMPIDKKDGPDFKTKEDTLMRMWEKISSTLNSSKRTVGTNVTSINNVIDYGCVVVDTSPCQIQSGSNIDIDGLINVLQRIKAIQDKRCAKK